MSGYAAAVLLRFANSSSAHALMAYALLGLFVVLVIFQAVMLWKSSPNWRWFQIVPIVLTMILSVVFVFPTAVVLKSRSEWHKVKEDLEKRLIQVRAEQDELRWGDPRNPNATDGVLPSSQALAKLTTEAGRRWRNLQLGQAKLDSVPMTIVLNEAAAPAGVDGLPAEEAADDEPAAKPSPLIPDGLVVYGFAERPQPDLPTPIPAFYLGEYRVTASTPRQVTLTPTGPLLPSQIDAIKNRGAASWSIYELLPLDGHVPFLAAGSVPDDSNVFGRVDDALVRQVLGKNASAETLKAYLEDGRRSQPDDPPLARWTKVKFTKNHSIVVDSPDQRGALDGGFFDGSGRAVDSRLQHGDTGAVEFAKDEEYVFHEEAANELIDEGVATSIDSYFVRPLNDYRFVLRRIRLRVAELNQRATELQFEQGVLQRAIDATVAMLADYQTQKLKLEQDLMQTEVERIALTKYNDDLQATVKQTRERLVGLYRENQQMETQLEQIHFSIEQQVDSLTSTR